MLIIPQGGIYIFASMKKGELVKQSEMDLIAEAALIAAAYKSEVETRLVLEAAIGEYGSQSDSPAPSED